MKTLPLPSQERLRYLFYYNEKTGAFYARFKKTKRKIGQRGTLQGGGYRAWTVDGTCYLEHRLIWMYTYGEDPGDLEIDHKDNIKTNNWLSNLRLATRVQNNQNRNPRGISWDKRTKKWESRITVDAKKIHLGYFVCEQNALNAYEEARQKYFGEFA